MAVLHNFSSAHSRRIPPNVSTAASSISEFKQDSVIKSSTTADDCERLQVLAGAPDLVDSLDW
jgi:hypothetical protein